MSDHPRCCAKTKPRWYQPEPVPCSLPAWKDGYCRKHHPVVRARSLGKKLVAAERSLASAQKRAAALEVEIENIKAEQAKWDAFLHPENASGEGREEETPESD